MRQTRTRRAAVAVLLLWLGPSAAWAGKQLEDIPLVWKPTNHTGTGVLNLAGISNVKMRVEPFADSRPDPKKIGENREGSTPKPVTTSARVADFCAQQVSALLKQYGLTVADDNADVVIGGEVLEFMVIETGRYQGDVRLKLTVSRGEKQEWAGVASGSSSRFGRSYKAENYYETLSDALLEAAEKAVHDEGFRKAVAGN